MDIFWSGVENVDIVGYINSPFLLQQLAKKQFFNILDNQIIV